LFSFLNPLALLGLFAAALPLVIHLLSRWRTRRLDFSSLMLLRRVQSQNVRRLRTKQWLLLLLRTLIIALLMLVPARPVVRGLLGTGPADHLPVEAVIVSDISASVRYVASHGRTADMLNSRLDSLYSWLRPGDRYRLLRADILAREITGGWQEVSGQISQNESVSHGLEPGFGGTSLAGALEQASRMFSAEDQSFRREIYLFSDRQRGFLGSDSLALDSTAGINYYLVTAGGEQPHNVAIQSVGFPGELVRPGAPLEVTLELARFGGDSLLPVFPRVSLDNRLVGQGETTLEPGGRATVVVEVPPLEPGYHELAAEIDADPLAADNRRSIVIWVPPVANVLLVERDLTAGPDYLGSALQVLSNRRTGALALRRSSSLPVSPSELAAADVVIVHGLDHPQGRVTQFLTELRRQDRHALLIPRAGESVPQGFTDAVIRMGLPLEPGSLIQFGDGGFDLPQRVRAAAGGDLFDNLFGAIDGLSRARLFAIRALPPVEHDESVWDLGTRAGRTWLRLVRSGGGNLILSATDLGSTAETELPGTPLFVPLVNSLITMLTHTGPLVRQSAVVGEDVTVYFGGPENTSGMELHGPGGERWYLPPGERTRWTFSGTDQPGAYWLYRDGNLAGGFAVGLDPAESDIREEPYGRIDAVFEGLAFHKAPADEPLEQHVLLGRGGVEVWPWLLIAALVLLGVEQVVANRRRDEEEL
jgi:hypothetical protein